jgi:DNA-binding transcriptional ArsR family regulator
MQGDDIRDQIEALRQEVRGLGNSILNLRQDDMRKVFGDHIRPVLVDRIERHYARMMASGIPVAIPKASLIELVDRSITMFQRHGRTSAMEMVKDLEDGLVHDKDTGHFEAELIAQLREYLMLSDTIFNQTVPDLTVERGVRNGPGPGSITPDSFERFLAPLSNAKRVQVMLVLSRESNSLAELCRELDLQKGHLQFHLKALVDVDYIRFDRKSRLYTITPRGTLVLEGVTELMEDLMALP